MSTQAPARTSEGLGIFQVDAFAETAFEGNPAAVCLLEQDLYDANWAQHLAAEMNLSETALLGPPRSDGSRGLRWFTPSTEVDLCGHATLAAAAVLWSVQEPGTGASEQRFATRSGELVARPNDVTCGANLHRTIELDFPARAAERCSPPEHLIEALGVVPSSVGRSCEADLLVEVESVDFVSSLQPDMALLETIPARGVIVTAAVRESDQVRLRSDGRRPDFVSRFFGPACGVPEDPVTGSAHCTLAPFWSQRLKRDQLVGFQASSRGGFVETEVTGERVLLRGGAVVVLSGRLSDPAVLRGGVRAGSVTAASS